MPNNNNKNTSFWRKVLLNKVTKYKNRLDILTYHSCYYPSSFSGAGNESTGHALIPTNEKRDNDVIAKYYLCST